MKVSAIIKKYTASSENNCYQNNNRELQKQQSKIFTFDSRIIQLDNTVNNSHLI